jgi:hypothetical protein
LERLDFGGGLVAFRTKYAGHTWDRHVFQGYRRFAAARGEGHVTVWQLRGALKALGWTAGWARKAFAGGARYLDPPTAASYLPSGQPQNEVAGTPETVSPAPLTPDDLDDVIEPRYVGLAFGLTSSAAYFGNDVIARGPRPQLVAALRAAVETFVPTGQGPQGLAHDPCPPTDGLWFTFDAARGAWRLTSPAGVRFIGSGVDLLAVLRALV